MRIALTVWQDGIATVADFAPHLILVDIVDGQVGERSTVEAPGREAACWSDRLAAAGVSTLLCGAISRYLQQRLAQAGITVIAGCSGPVDAVLAAWPAGSLVARPACHHRQRRRRGFAHRFLTRTPDHTMRLAITTTGPAPESALDPRFGRCRHVLVGDQAGTTLVHHENPVPAVAEHGAGIRTAEFVAGLGVQVVITGAVGPKAMQVLRASGIRVFACETMAATAALDLLRDGKLSEIR